MPRQSRSLYRRDDWANGTIRDHQLSESNLVKCFQDWSKARMSLTWYGCEGFPKSTFPRLKMALLALIHGK